MRQSTVTFALVFILSNIGFAQEAGTLPEECRPLIMELKTSINRLLENIDSLESDKAEAERVIKLDNQFIEGARTRMVDLEIILQTVDTTFTFFDERGDLLKDDVAGYKRLSDALYEKCVEPPIPPKPDKWKIPAAAVAGFLLGLAL
ncbi:MAG: hypothetical protein V3W14_00605 [Candidatus Neomarinimicrobiota bacterium]